jgi:hypothetical protein
MSAPTMRWTRLARRLGRRRNPLCRRSDLIEAWLLPAVVAAFCVLGPLVAGGGALWARADNAAAHRAQLSWHQVHAVLLQAAPGPMMPDNGANTWMVWTPARWTAGGRPRLGNVPAASGTPAGSAVPVWLDRAGHAQLPPLTAAQAADRVIRAMATWIAGLALLLIGSALLARRALDRRRLAGWETDWLSVGPQWSGRR